MAEVSRELESPQLTDGADEEGPEPGGFDLLVVADQVEEAVLDTLVPRLVTEHRQLLEERLAIVSIPGGGVLGDGLDINSRERLL